MAITDLNHYFVWANDLEQSRRFYCEGLGLEPIPLPDMPVPRYWFGVGGKAIVHMGLSEDPTVPQEHARIDHVAFSASDPKQFLRRLRSLGLEPDTRYVAELKIFQILAKDPNGINVELNFSNVESEPTLE